MAFDRPIQKVCVWCGKSFETLIPAQKNCSDECKRKHRTEMARNLRAAKREARQSTAKGGGSIEQIAKEALSLGMSYGEYVRRYLS